jgi:hypothetical protein
MELVHRGRPFKFFGAEEVLLREIYATPLMQNWLSSLDESIIVKTVEFQSLIRSSDGRIERVKISTVSERNGVNIPRILILLGWSIAVLVVINGKSIVLVEKPRIATGGLRLEIPLASTEGQQPTPDVAARILAKETGIEANSEDFIDLLKSVRDVADEGIHPYCGPSDRQVFVYLLNVTMSEQEMAKMEGRIVAPNSRVRILDYGDAGTVLVDCIGLSVLLFHEKYLELQE